MKLRLTTPKNFSFWRTVFSHGWCSLPPFAVDKKQRTIRRVLHLSSNRIIETVWRSPSVSTIVIEIPAVSKLSLNERHEIISSVKSSLRLDEDFSEFYREAKRHRSFRWVPRIGAGRLLRAPTVFEDVVKMICTTNCSWALTEIMVDNLCLKIGRRVDNGRFSFPTPEAMAECSERFYRKEIRAGYRAPYFVELSRRIVDGKLNVETWRHSTTSTEELYQEVRSVKGIGPYAAGNILKLLGRYDYLAIDSWCRKKFFELHKNGRRASDKTIERFYESFGSWRGLFFWMDVTKYWYAQEFPF